MFGRFEVLSVESNNRYCMLKLPDSYKIHAVFNISLLEQYRGDDPKKQVVEIEGDGGVWPMESIIASGPSDDNPKQHVFLVNWGNFSHENNTWET
jgi:hypothetical protein